MESEREKKARLEVEYSEALRRYRTAQSTRDREVRESIDAVLGTEPGKKLFEYLYEILGWRENSVVMNPNTREINPISTIYNDAKRESYGMLRRRASLELLAPVEQSYEDRMRGLEENPRKEEK